MRDDELDERVNRIQLYREARHIRDFDYFRRGLYIEGSLQSPESPLVLSNSSTSASNAVYYKIVKLSETDEYEKL